LRASASISRAGRFLAAIAAGVERANLVLTIVASGLIAVVSVGTLLDAGGRYFSRPITGLYELSVLLFVALTFLAFGVVQWTRGNIAVDVAVRHLPPQARRILDIVTLTLAFILIAIASHGTIVQAAKSWAILEYEAGYAQFPLYPSKTVVAIGCTYLAFILLLQITGRVLELLGAPSIEPEPDEDELAV
jgi:TRAP-type C4-dicarboxylate transport system permease small subunit